MRIAEDGTEVMYPCSVYRLYNESGDLLYVGITKDHRKRFVSHARTQPWWPEVARHTLVDYPDRGDAAAAEREAIRTEHPRHNVSQHEMNAIRARNDQRRRPWYVYRVYNARGALLYVGMTLNPARRLAEHGDDTRWWSEVSMIKVEQLPNLDAALTAERKAIRSERPRYNITHA